MEEKRERPASSLSNWRRSTPTLCSKSLGMVPFAAPGPSGGVEPELELELEFEVELELEVELVFDFELKEQETNLIG